MKTIFITIAEDMIARNIFFTDFWPTLKKGLSDVRTVILVPDNRVDYYRAFFTDYDILVEGYKKTGFGRFDRIIFSLSRSCLNSKTNLWSKMRSYNRGDSSLLATYVKRFHTFICGRSTLYKRFLRWMILLVSPTPQIKYLYDSYKPDELIATSLTNFDFDVPFAREARRRKVKVLGMVRSWDNFSSHGMLRVVPDVFFLQNLFLKDMADQYQSFPKIPMYITGLPHYDVYKDVSKIIKSREDFFKETGLDPKKQLLFYGAMGEFLFVHEHELPKIFNNLIENQKFGTHTEMLYRAHPKFKIPPEKIVSYPHIIFDTEGTYLKDVSGTKSRDENEHFINALYHSDVVITGASTIALDAIVLDKPVICVDFDGKTAYTDVPYWDSVNRFYDSYTHFEELVKTGAVRIAHSPDELVSLVLEYKGDSKKDAAGREMARKRFIEPFDGNSGIRLAQLLVKEIHV